MAQFSNSKISITVDKVIKICEWQLEARKQLSPIDADNVIAKLECNIRKKLSSRSLTDRELKQQVNAHRTGLWSFKAAIQNLENANEIKFNQKTKKWEIMEL